MRGAWDLQPGPAATARGRAAGTVKAPRICSETGACSDCERQGCMRVPRVCSEAGACSDCERQGCMRAPRICSEAGACSDLGL